MLWHHVKVHTSAEKFPQEEQLAWKIAEVAADPVGVERDVAEMIANRVIDNAAVAIAAINRRPVVSARSMALAHSRKMGAAIFGIESGQTYSPEWAAWANGTAVRELDMHDTFLAADFGHHLHGHRLIAFVIEITRRATFGVVARDAFEIHERSIFPTQQLARNRRRIDGLAS